MDGLHLGDASIMQDIVGGNANFPEIFMAEKCSGACCIGRIE